MPGGDTGVGRSRRSEGSRMTRDGLAADAAWGSRRDIQGIVNGCLGQASNSNFGFARSLRLPIDTDLATVGLP